MAFFICIPSIVLQRVPLRQQALLATFEYPDFEGMSTQSFNDLGNCQREDYGISFYRESSC